MRNLKAIGIVAAGAVALTATLAASQNRGQGAGVPDVRALAVPVVRVLRIGDTIVQLDTRTGAILSLNGDAGARGSSANWRASVPGVSGSHSGVLDIQRTQETGSDGIFLVDLREGTTWVLRWRGNQNGSWARVQLTR